MPETVNIPVGKLLEAITITQCPECETENRYHWIPGMKPVPRDFNCHYCKVVYSLPTDD